MTRIGADADNELCLSGAGVLPFHARIARKEDGYWLEPAADQATIALNGRVTRRMRLTSLDVISLSPSVDLVFLEADAPPVPRSPIESATLEWLNGPDAGQRVPVGLGELVIGRDAACGIVIDAQAVSRNHCRLVLSADGLTIEDLDSANGTQVNDRDVSAVMEVTTGDRITVGKLRTCRVALLRIGDSAPAASAVVQQPVAAKDVVAVSQPEKSDEGTQLDVRPVGTAEIPPATETEPQPSRIVAYAPANVPPIGEAIPSPDPHVPEPAADPTVRGSRWPPEIVPSFDASSADATRIVGQKPMDVPAFAENAPVVPDATTTVVSPDSTPPERETRAPAQSEPMTLPDPSITGLIVRAELISDDARHVIPLGRTVVGRPPDCGLSMPSRTVSRAHAAILVTPEHVLVEDLGSENGTTVNGETVLTARPLADGDTLSFAELSFRVQIVRSREAT